MFNLSFCVQETNNKNNVYFRNFCENLEKLGLSYEEVERDYKYSGGNLDDDDYETISEDSEDDADYETISEDSEDSDPDDPEDSSSSSSSSSSSH